MNLGYWRDTVEQAMRGDATAIAILPGLAAQLRKAAERVDVCILLSSNVLPHEVVEDAITRLGSR